MIAIRTPESCFENLEGYPFDANYLQINADLRMHYVEEGHPEGELVLLLHGEPSWSYLYRTMIPVLTEAGLRVIAPDLIGFGKSDKPTEQSDYTYQNHLNWLTTFIEKLDLNKINLFCQDWGGLLGLRIAADNPQRFARIVAANTILPTGDVAPNEAFMKWREYSRTVPVLNVPKIIQKATVNELSPEILAGYNAPFPSAEYMAGAKIFPSLVPISSDHPQTEANRAAWVKLAQWQKPFLTLFSDSDPIMKGMEKIFQKIVPGAKGQKHHIIAGGGHFLQEDKGEEIAQHLVKFIEET